MSETNPAVQNGERRESVPRRGIRRRAHHGVRFTTTEWAAIVAASNARGRKPATLVREAALAVLPGAQSTLGNAPLIRELGRCGTALAALAGTARATGALPEAASVEAALAELLAAVRRVDKPEQPGAAP
jgi:hypothetical protein